MHIRTNELFKIYFLIVENSKMLISLLIKKIQNVKAYTSHPCSEMLTWTGLMAKEWIGALKNPAITQGFLEYWKDNRIRTHHYDGIMYN